VSLKDVVLVTPALATELSRSITVKQQTSATRPSATQHSGVHQDAVLACTTAVLQLVPAMIIKLHSNVAYDLYTVT
jgi:hypothetical protein